MDKISMFSTLPCNLPHCAFALVLPNFSDDNDNDHHDLARAARANERFVGRVCVCSQRF